MWQHRIRRGRANIEKEGTARFQHAPNFRGPFPAPLQIRLSILPVGKLTVTNAKIVRRRGHDQVDLSIRQTRHAFHAILPTKIELHHGPNLSQSSESYNEIRERSQIRYCFANVRQAFE